MKKIVYAIILMFVACGQSDNKGKAYGKGGENAVKYVMEQVAYRMEGVVNVEVTNVDSLLTDEVFNESSFKKLADAFVAGQINENEFHNIVDSVGTIGRDLYFCWKTGESNDSLKKLDKYKNQWRTVYTVTVTTESTAQRDIRVMMDADGIKPIMTEEEFKQKRNNDKGIISAMTQRYNWDY